MYDGPGAAAAAHFLHPVADHDALPSVASYADGASPGGKVKGRGARQAGAHTAIVVAGSWWPCRMPSQPSQPV